jgi:hypothetical protein
MATYNVTERDPQNNQIIAARVLSFDDAATAQPVKVNAVSPIGTIVSGALPTVQLVTATGAQVSTTRDVDTYTLLTSSGTNAIATCTVALSPDNSTYSTICVPALAAAVNNVGAVAIPLSVRVPAGWYIKLTSTLFTIGVTTYA